MVMQIKLVVVVVALNTTHILEAVGRNYFIFVMIFFFLCYSL